MISGMFESAVPMGKKLVRKAVLAIVPSWSLMPYSLARIMWAMAMKPWAGA